MACAESSSCCESVAVLRKRPRDTTTSSLGGDMNIPTQQVYSSFPTKVEREEERRRSKMGSRRRADSRERLLRLHDVPFHLQFNRYIRTGYRPQMCLWECAMSLFHWHNETVNILTHGIPLMCIAISIPYLLPWQDISVPFLPYSHVVAIMSPWLGSSIYHLFMNHKRGEDLYDRLLQLDMVGIWVTQSFGALTTVYASIYCLPLPLKRFTLVFYAILSGVALYKAMVARDPWQRRLSFTLQFCLRACLFCLRLTSLGGGDPSSIMHVILQDTLAILGGAIGALRVPERWIPGRLDNFGNSHHIMHVLVVVAIVHMHVAARYDLVWMSKDGECQVTWSS